MRETSYPISRKYSAIVMPVYTDASRAATGIELVLQMMTVLSIRVRPVRGSVIVGNVFSVTASQYNSGVYEAAKKLGFKFLLNLTEPVTLKGVERPPLVPLRPGERVEVVGAPTAATFTPRKKVKARWMSGE